MEASTPTTSERGRWVGLDDDAIIERLEQRLAERNRTIEQLRAEVLAVHEMAEEAVTATKTAPYWLYRTRELADKLAASEREANVLANHAATRSGELAEARAEIADLKARLGEAAAN